ncbi:hypothetical protein RKD39_001847 [Streptomyces albogriseolus]
MKCKVFRHFPRQEIVTPLGDVMTNTLIDSTLDVARIQYLLRATQAVVKFGAADFENEPCEQKR